MRTHFILISFFSFTLGFSQNKLPIVKSITKQVKIVENTELVTGWNLVQEAKPDMYISGKNTKRAPGLSSSSGSRPGKPRIIAVKGESRITKQASP